MDDRRFFIVSYKPSGELICKGLKKNKIAYVPFIAETPRLLSMGPLQKYLEQIRGFFYNKKLKQALKQIRPSDVLLMIKGNKLYGSTKKMLVAANCKKVAMTLDSLDRAVIQKDICELSDVLILQDAGDLKKYPLKQSFHLPLGYDEEVFYPLELKRTTDICLVGNFYPKLYQNRHDLIKKLGTDPRFAQYKISVIGSSGSASLNETLKSELPGINFLGKLGYKDINVVLNSSRVVVNLHQNDGIEPVNPWLFMIAGTRTCQVTDERNYLRKYFGNEEIIMAEVSGIPDVLLKLLKEEDIRSEVADKGYDRAIKEHSSGSRARTIGELVK